MAESVATLAGFPVVLSLMEQLRSECELLSGMAVLGVPPNVHQQLLLLRVHSIHSSFAVDMRNSSVLVSMVCETPGLRDTAPPPSLQFLNDLERDKTYSMWPSSLQEVRLFLSFSFLSMANDRIPSPVFAPSLPRISQIHWQELFPHCAGGGPTDPKWCRPAGVHEPLPASSHPLHVGHGESHVYALILFLPTDWDYCWCLTRGRWLTPPTNRPEKHWSVHSATFLIRLHPLRHLSGCWR